MESTNSSSNWLGFSLSPHLNMEVPAELHHQTNHHHQSHHHHHHHQQQQAQPTPAAAVSASPPGSSFFLAPPHLSSNGVCFGVGENGGFYSQLSVMPLKSDGSLCIMEALTRSHQEAMVPSASPKLEDFLGCGPNMGTHQYANNDREAMALSLDSMYYHQNPETENNRNHPLDLLQQPFRQDIHVHEHHQQQQQQQNHHPYFQPLQEGMSSAMAGHEMYQTPMEEEHIANDGMLKSWVTRHYMACNNGVGGEEGVLRSGAMGGYGDLHPLSLSMSPGSQSSCVTAPQHICPTATIECMTLDTARKSGNGKAGQKQPVHRKSIDTFGQRTSQYRGVTRHRWTGRYEAHLWDNSCKKEGQTRKGRQVYLGGYDMEEKAARAYDLAALKYWGPSTHINFLLEDYQEELEGMQNMSRQEYVAHLRRKSSGFSRGASIYRGVTRHHQHGRWQARIGRVAGNKDLYLGTFSTQEEAAEAYDIAAIKFRGLNAVTNFDITRYDVERIMASNTLLSGELARRNKPTEVAQSSGRELELTEANNNNGGGSEWKMTLSPTSASLTDFQNHHLSANLRGLVGIDSVNEIDDLGRVGNNNHVSNASSMVTSLSSSGDGSPDSSLSVLFARPAPPPNKIISPVPVSSWDPTAQLRPAITMMSHMPVFAAWTDA